MYKTLFVVRPDNMKHRKHTKKEDWLNVYFFTDRQNRELIYNNEYYRKNSLYYESVRSENNDVWDYYKILKPCYNGHNEVAILKKKNLDIVRNYKEVNKYDNQRRKKISLTVSFD